MKAGIIGVTGYGGLELFRLLSAHPEIDELFVFSSSKAGQELSDEVPHLYQIFNNKLRSIEQLDPGHLDVLFCSAPSGVSSELLPPLTQKKLKIIDLAGDFRIKDADTYRKWYRKEPPPTPLAANAVYGLTEWNREQVKKGELIANPGCYPTATLLGLLPLLKEGILNPSSLVIDAKSGISGAGASTQSATHFSKVNDSFSIYKINEHQHIPEIEQTIKTITNVDTNITFTTHLVPMTRGIMATMYAELADGVNSQSIKEIYHECYDTKRFVRIFDEKTNLFTKQVYGSNYCDITYAADERTNRITVVSVIDNLIKGAAGQAVQNMNVMFDLDESEGLNQLPMFP